MSHHATEQGVLFSDLSKKAVVARFDQRRSSSDGAPFADDWRRIAVSVGTVKT